MHFWRHLKRNYIFRLRSAAEIFKTETNWCSPWSFHSDIVFSSSDRSLWNAPTICDRLLRVFCIVALTLYWGTVLHKTKHRQESGMKTNIHSNKCLHLSNSFWMRLINWLEWARAQFHFFHFSRCLLSRRPMRHTLLTLRCMTHSTRGSRLKLLHFILISIRSPRAVAN